MRSESLDDDRLAEPGERPDDRPAVAVAREAPPRVPLPPEERPEPDDRLAPGERVACFAAAPEDRRERVAFFAGEPEDRLEPVAFFAVEPALRVAGPAPLEAAAALVCGDAAGFVFRDAAALTGRDGAGAFVRPLLEPEERDDALDVLLAELRAVVAALGELPLPVLALLLVGFSFVCFPAFFVVATGFPFPELLMRYPMASADKRPHAIGAFSAPLGGQDRDP